MLNRNALVVFVLLLCAGLFMALRDDADSRDTRADDLDRNTVTRIDESTPRKAAELDTSIQPASDLITESKTRTAVEAEAPATAAPSATSEPRGRIRGQVVAPNRAPLAGVNVSLNGWVGNNQRALQFGVPDDWEQLSTATDADGRFELRFDPPRAFQFFLDATFAGYANESWRWTELAPAVDLDLGQIALRLGGEIEGRVVNAAGEPVASAWRVYAARPPGEGFAEGRQPSRSISSYDPVAQRFRLIDLPAGPATLKANSQLGGWLIGPKVQVVAGETVLADIVYTGPDLSRRIEVTTFSNPFFILAHLVNEVRLTGPNYDQTVDLTRGTSQSFAFDDLEEGSYTVTIESPLFQVFVRSGVQVGERVSARLVPNAQLTLDVVDATTGAALTNVRAQLRLDDYSNTTPNIFLVHEGELPSQGLLPPVVPGNTTLLVDAPGYSTMETPIESMGAGETRHVRVELQPASLLVGTVHHADGSPASDTQVLVMAPGQAPRLRALSFGKQKQLGAVFEAMTDAEGQYRIEGLLPGSYDLYAIGNAWQLASALDVTVRSGTETRANLRLPRGAGLRLTLQNTDGPPPGKQVIFRTTVEPLFRAKGYQTMTGRDIPLTKVSATEWVGEALPAGPGQVALVSAVGEFRFGSTHLMLEGATHTLAEVDLIEGQVTSVTADLGGLEPGAIQIQALRDGQPVAGLQVAAKLDNTSAGVARTDSDGRAVITGLFPGEYQASVYVAEMGEFRVPAPVAIAAGQTRSVVVDLSGVPGELIVRKPDGELLTRFTITVQCENMVTMTHTDEQGRLKMTLPVGTGQLVYATYDRDLQEQTDAVATFDWPPPEGGVEVQLRFE